MEELIEIRASQIHGHGAFAKTMIPSGVCIVEYVGEKIDKRESLRRCTEDRNEFIFALDDQCDLDGSVDWNPARYFNHSCAPNCEAEFVDGKIWIITRREILPGEEITFNYSYELENYREHPCQCGAPQCIGFIVAEEYFSDLRKISPGK